MNNNLIEKLEKHKTLNPKLFKNEVLKEVVRVKIFQIVDQFTETLEEEGIKLLIKDIVLIGSNANYNYTNNSDIDLHIIADTKALKDNHKVYKALYSAYRSLFNKNFDIDFYGIPVEIYVETEDIKTKSNGVYSVKKNEWLKKPKIIDIPELDQDKLKKEVDKWVTKSQDLKKDAKNKKPDIALRHIIEFIEDIYELRKTSLKDEGEYSIGNQTFKEIRNLGILDEMKELKNKVISKKLSLESLRKELTRRQIDEYRVKIARLAQDQPIVQSNGYFFIHNVSENDIDFIINNLKRQPFIEYIRKGAAGRYDFSHIQPFKQPQRLYTIEGKVKL